MDVGSNNQQLTLLFDRLKEQFAHERRSHEKKMAEAKARRRSSSESHLCSDHESDSDDDSVAPENTFRMPTQSCGTAAVEKSCSGTTDAENPSKPQVVDNDKEAQSSPPPYSPPAEILSYVQDDDCDEAEKIARAKRIEVILKLSAEAKAKEAEKKRVANIKPLAWDKPTFDYPSTTSDSGTAAAAAAATAVSKASQESTSAKRKSRQEEMPPSNPYFGPGRAPTEEEIQSLVDFTNTWFPKRRRITDDKSGDDNEKPKSA